MSQEQSEYKTETKAAIIERPHKVHAVGDKGLEDYQVNGWVKMSAKFCGHIKKLRGAKLAIWLCLALTIDENGECKLSQKELCGMTGYSHTEVIDSVKELDEMGFLSVDRSGKKNLYRPVFVSKGKGNSPSKETLVKKLDSTPLDSLESSPLLENSSPTSIKKKKEGDLVDAEIFYHLQPKAIKDAMAKHFKLTPNWEAKYNRQFMEWAVESKMTPDQIEKAADLWRMDKRFNWSVPTLKGIQEHWLELIEPEHTEPLNLVY